MSNVKKNRIMKKIYISPAVEVVALSHVNMIAQSIGDGTTEFEGVQDGDSGEYGDTKADKGWDIWNE